MKTNKGQTESSPESTEAQPLKRQKPSEADLKTMAGFALTDEMKAELEREQKRGSSRRSKRSSRLTDAFGQNEARPSRVTVQPPQRAASEDSAKTTIGFAQAESSAQRESSVKPQLKPGAASPQSARPQVESRRGGPERVEAPKVEAPKVEAPKVEIPNVEAPKVEAPKVEAPKVEAPKAELQAQGEPARSELEPIVEPVVQKSAQPEPQLEPSAPPHQVEAIPKSSILHELVTPMPHSETVLGDEIAELKVDWFSSEVVFEDETQGPKITFGKIFIVLSILCAGAVAYVSQQPSNEAITEKPTETTETPETPEKTETSEKPTETSETTEATGTGEPRESGESAESEKPTEAETTAALKLKAEAEAKLKAEAEAEAKRKAEEEAKLKAEAEAEAERKAKEEAERKAAAQRAQKRKRSQKRKRPQKRKTKAKAKSKTKSKTKSKNVGGLTAQQKRQKFNYYIKQGQKALKAGNKRVAKLAWTRAKGYAQNKDERARVTKYLGMVK